MAGEGIKLFLSGDVLTASDLNGYLMDQVVSVFDDATDRNNAFGDGIPVANGGSGKPLLTAGRFCYLLDLQEVQYYNGSTWQAASQFSIENGSITEVKLASNAVTAGKLASDAVIEAKIGTGAVTESKLGSGAVTEAKIASGAVTSDKIADGTIVNADINASAAIAHSKLANATAGQVLLGTTTTGVVTATTVSGDITITGAGVTAISSGVIVDADVNASAAIADTKLATISTANKVSLASLDIDGATDIGAALTDVDLFIVDDGAGGTNRKTEASRLAAYLFGKVSGAVTIGSTGTATLANDNDQLVLAARLFI